MVGVVFGFIFEVCVLYFCALTAVDELTQRSYTYEYHMIRFGIGTGTWQALNVIQTEIRKPESTHDTNKSHPESI
jgi:hypothetical protein